MTAPHDHELDGRLHLGCPMCELIAERRAGLGKRERDADVLARRYARIASIEASS
jgi:hypothetical protein